MSNASAYYRMAIGRMGRAEGLVGWHAPQVCRVLALQLPFDGFQSEDKLRRSRSARERLRGANRRQ